MTSIRLFSLALALGLAACAAGAPVPADRFHRIEAPPARAEQAIGAIIGLDPVRAGGIYAERALLYARNGALEQRRYDFWAESPDRMLDDALLAYLRGAFGAQRVVTGGGRVRADWTVRTRVLRLEQVGDGARMALELEFAVSDAAGRTVEVLKTGGERALDGSSPQDFVRAVTVQCAESFAALEARVRALASADREP